MRPTICTYALVMGQVEHGEKVTAPRPLPSFVVDLYHDDRTHLGKYTPARRSSSLPHGPVIARARLGGLHHRYDRIS